MYLAWRETISGVVHNDRTCLREIIVVQNDRQVFEVNYPTVLVCRFASGIKEHNAHIMFETCRNWKGVLLWLSCAPVLAAELNMICQTLPYLLIYLSRPREGSSIHRGELLSFCQTMQCLRFCFDSLGLVERGLRSRAADTVWAGCLRSLGSPHPIAATGASVTTSGGSAETAGELQGGCRGLQQTAGRCTLGAGRCRRCTQWTGLDWEVDRPDPGVVRACSRKINLLSWIFTESSVLTFSLHGCLPCMTMTADLCWHYFTLFRKRKLRNQYKLIKCKLCFLGKFFLQW